MVLIVGLGNPGSSFARTRHNVGFMVVDELAQRHRTTFQPGRGPWNEASMKLRGEEAVLVKPSTFMNVSGVAVAELVGLREDALQRLLVVVDDFQLPLGQLRLRQRGSDGGHNGLLSVIQSLGTGEVPRLRCGIASHHMPTDKDRLADFVLEAFHADEAEAVRVMVKRAADACEAALLQGWATAMNEFNRSSTDEVDDGT